MNECLQNTVERIGRHFRDLIFNLDNCHDYFRLRFVNMHAPSFFVDSENPGGLILIYRSKRRGFAHYVSGQMRQLGRAIYDIDVQVVILSQEVVVDTFVVTFELKFFNSCFVNCRSRFKAHTEASLPVRAGMLLNIFPFAIVFYPDEALTVSIIGPSLRSVLPSLLNRSLKEVFDLERPLVEYCAQAMLQRTNNVFFFRLKEVKDDDSHQPEMTSQKIGSTSNMDEKRDDRLVLRGQILWMEEWKRIFFFGSPMVEVLDDLLNNGLRLNDLAMHDYSRETLLNSTQKELEVRLSEVVSEQRKQMLATLEEQMAKTRSETESKIAESLSPAIRILEADKGDRTWHVTQLAVLCARIHNFNAIVSRSSDPYDVLSLVDSLASAFDYLVDFRGGIRVESTDTLVAIGNFVGVSDDEASTHLENLAKMAIELSVGVTQTMREPKPMSRPLRLTSAINFGSALVSLVQWTGRMSHQLRVHGEALHDCLNLMESTEASGCILLTEKAMEALSARNFKMNKVKVNKDQRVWVLDQKQRHRTLSLVGLLTAYTRFKHQKNSYEQHASINENILNNTAACGGFAQSKVCSIQ